MFPGKVCDHSDVCLLGTSGCSYRLELQSPFHPLSPRSYRCRSQPADIFFMKCPCLYSVYTMGYYRTNVVGSRTSFVIASVRSSVHWNTLELFHQPTLMHSFLYSLTICLLHYYPRHVSSIDMPIFRRKNCIHTASGIFALCKRLHSTLVETGLRGVRSQPVYCADVYRERRYQMLCEYNFSSWRWAC